MYLDDFLWLQIGETADKGDYNTIMVTAGTNSTVTYTSGSHKYVPCPFFVTTDRGDCRQRGLQNNALQLKNQLTFA